MVLRADDAQFMIYQPDRVGAAFEAMNAAALVMFGAWLQKVAKSHGGNMEDHLGHIGTVMSEIGFARTQINAGLHQDVPDVLVHAQRLWDEFSKYQHEPNAASYTDATAALEQLDGALTYLHERTMETGTDHPRWNSRIVSGIPCEHCGRT
jgi:hypothetical protein